MSEIGLNKRALLYQQLANKQYEQSATVNDPFAGHSLASSQQPDYRTWAKKFILVAGGVLLLHASVWYIAQQFPTKPLPETKSEPVVIEIVKPIPKEEPPKVIEPEIIKPKIPPVTQKPQTTPVVQKPQPVQKAQDRPQPVQKTTPTPVPQVVQPLAEPVATENTRPIPTPNPAPTPVEPAVEKSAPVTEAKGYAGYLSNPAPEYPEMALERGWEGSVILRVKVSPSGSPVSVNVKQGSGRKALDDAAVRTVKRWKFSPAMRGSTPIEGWVDVPIDYRLPR